MVALATLLWTPAAFGDEARVHVIAGAAHAVGGAQEREFGAGGGGAATVELAVGSFMGVQGSAGALVLAPGAAPADPNVAPQGTGTAFLGTVGVRFRPLGALRVAGPWIDTNGGVAQTGNEPRIAVDAHLGWDFRVSRASRWDVGPFVGFTQIMQPDVKFRPDDAHVLWAGVQISLGATERPRAVPPANREQPEPASRDRDGFAEVEDFCRGCPTPEVTLVGDRIVIDDIIHFEFDSPVIRSTSFSLVRRVAEFIKDNPGILEISIEGHADARGTEEYNLRLSEERAASTRTLLVRFGVEDPRLLVVGHGKSRLKVPTPSAEARNRRVEFIVTRLADASGAAARPAPRVASGKRGRP